MKVFAIEMAEKSLVKDNAVPSNGVTMTATTTPIITFGKNRTSYKNYVIYTGTLFFIFLFAIIISKLVLYRIPNDLGMPWFELKNRMIMGCDDCMTSRIIQSFYPQRSSRIFKNSNYVTSPATLSVQAKQPQAIEQETSIASISRASESRSQVDLPQPVDFHLDFLRKIIPKIKERAEKSGVEGVMQVKVLQMDSFEPKQFLDKLDETQFRPVFNAPQQFELMTPSRSTLLTDLLRWNMGENDQKNGRNFPNLENQISENQFFESQQNDIAKSEIMPILGQFLQGQQLQLLPDKWDNNNNIDWSNSFHLLDLIQQISKQQWNNFWQWPNVAYNKNNDEKVASRQDIQWSKNQQYLFTPVSQQMQSKPSIPWESSNYWQDNVQMEANWQNGIQNQWAENEWKGYQYPQIGINQNQYQYNNDWNIQRQQPIASTAVTQSLKVLGLGLPYQVQNQSSRQKEQEQQQQQPQIMESLQSQTIQEYKIKPLSAQQEEQQSQIESQFPNQLQSVNIPVSRNGLDDSASQAILPVHFNSADWNWQRTENSNLRMEPVNNNQKQQQLLHRGRPELSIYPIENGSIGSSNGVKIIDNNLNKITITEKLEPVKDIGGFSNPTLFQVDEPSPQFSSMDESFAK